MSRSGPGLAAILGKEAARCLKIDYLSFLVSLKANPGVAPSPLFKASKKLVVAVSGSKANAAIGGPVDLSRSFHYEAPFFGGWDIKMQYSNVQALCRSALQIILRKAVTYALSILPKSSSME